MRKLKLRQNKYSICQFSQLFTSGSVRDVKLLINFSLYHLTDIVHSRIKT